MLISIKWLLHYLSAMNSVPQYRAAIGCYAPIAQNAQNMHKLRQTLHVTELYDSYDHMIHIYAKFLRHMIISFAGIYEYVFYACLRLRLILLANETTLKLTQDHCFHQLCKDHSIRLV